MFQQLGELLERPLGALLAFALGVALLLFGGHWLVTGAVTIARRLGVSRLVIGLTLVAAGTSSPEFFFNVIAALSGHGDLSFGNVDGSNIANIGFVLGLTALFRPLLVHGRVIKKELPWLLVVSGAMIGLPWIPLGGSGDPPGFGRAQGILMLGAFAVFMMRWYRMGRRDAADPLVQEVEQEVETGTRASTATAIFLLVLGMAFLVGGGKLAEIGAVGIARWLGLSDALIGLLIVAVATSLPELVTAIIACLKGHDDLAVGNVVGSNFFNLLLVLAVTATVAPVGVPTDPGLSGFAAMTGLHDLIMMFFITMILLPMAVTHGRRIRRGEGGVLLALWGIYMAWRVVREVG